MVNENEVITIKLDDIIPNRFQPREMFDEQAMQELADSIKTHGVIQPIIVRPVDNKYEIIAGERRYKASVMAGKTDIPALVRNKDDKDSSIIAFIENSQRKDMTAIEEARTCERILKNSDITQEQLSKQLGMSQSTLANKLRLLALPIEIQDSLLHGEISERHARSMLSIKDTRKQLDLLDKVKNEKLTVRELDGVIKNMLEANSNGLYDLPGSEEYKIDTGVDSGMDFSRYENPVDLPDTTPTPAPTQESNQFLDFINSMNNNPVANEIENAIQDSPKESTNNNEFLTFLNNFDESKIKTTPADEVPLVEEQKNEEVSNNEFLTFLNNFDESKIKTETQDSLPPLPEIKENSEEITIPESNATEDKSFDDFLNSFNSSNEEVNKPIVSAPKEEVSNNEFLTFLNNFDESKMDSLNIPEAPKEEVEEPGNDFIDFMKKYEAPVATPVDLGPIDAMNHVEPPKEEVKEETVYDPNSKYLNPIEEVAPKTEYVENSPSYVDITKPISYDSVDSIIGKLKGVTDEIKKSKYKITTEETDFDDVYTITIKIDKRNFL